MRVPTGLVIAVSAAIGPLAACSGGHGAPAGTIAEARRAVPSTTTAPSAVTAEDPAALGAQLTSVEAAIRDPSTNADAVTELGRLQQSAYGVLVHHPDWQPAVAASVPEQLRTAVKANIRAGNELRALASTPKPELPQWRIVPPAPAAELLAEYKQAAADTGVGWEYLAAIHLVETRMGRIRGNSAAGARGPMQFIPSTWEIYGAGGDIESNHDAIGAAARMLKARGAPADMTRALYAYNPSNYYVRAISAYAEVMRADPRAYGGYHAWQVFYGDRLMPEGYGS